MHKQHDWNYKLGKFFLENSRLTFLSFFILIILGLVSTFGLKTTGFPSPDVGIVIVRGIYPGASSDTVLKDVTKPIEDVIKGVEGVETFSSNSQNSVSIVSAVVRVGFKSESVQNKISTEVYSLAFPDNVTVSISKPQIGGIDYIFSMTDEDSNRLYDSYQTVKEVIEKNPGTKNIKSDNDLVKQVVVEVDQSKLAQSGASVQSIQQALRSMSESLPITSNIQVDNQKSSIVSQYGKKAKLSNLNDLEIVTPTGFVKLIDVSKSITVKQKFVNGTDLILGSKTLGTDEPKPAVVFNVNLNDGVDNTKYLSAIMDELKTKSNISFDKLESGKSLLVNNYSITEQNKEQVDEVLSGLVGGPLKIENKTLANVGWLLGGIQLVFLMMMTFVSWRAAIIAAAAIPLSLIFTNIYLYFSGESLNTLVLFSFVLVIGLVVDPALVIIESIQRKIDAGLRGKQAALAAITDVGGGLFMATLTNIIVFAPFGLISGILGQIFTYIPLTIVPATIGSYLVPIVFLTWISSKILKKSKSAIADLPADADPDLIEKELHKSELENLWPISKWLIGLNKRILNSNWLVRLSIIALTFMLSMMVSAFFLGNGLIKSVQFSSPANPQNLILTINHKTTTLESDVNNINKEVVKKVMSFKDVHEVAPYIQGTYKIELNDATERKEVSVKLAERINAELRDKYLNQLFDIKVGILANGPDSSSYSVLLAIKESDLSKIKTASERIDEKLKYLCDNNNKISIDEGCKDNKIEIVRLDDGFKGKENIVNYVEFDRAKLASKGLFIPNSQAPSLIVPTSQIKNLFTLNDGSKAVEVDNDGKSLPVVLETGITAPTTLDAIRKITLFTPKGQPVLLTDVATIVTDSPLSTITRVKGETQGVIKIGFNEKYSDQQASAKISNAIIEYYSNENHTKELGLSKNSIKPYSEGGVEGFKKSFGELQLALLFAIIATYFVLAIFFKSLSQPLAILYTIPLTFIGVFPALTYLGPAQFGFLEIIGLIILVGIVENVAIFLIDCANNLIKSDGLSDKEAIATASGLRFRPVLLTKLTAIASLTPLAFLSETYRPISLVIIFGLLTSGFTSLITTPILYIFFRRLSEGLRNLFNGKKKTVISEVMESQSQEDHRASVKAMPIAEQALEQVIEQQIDPNQVEYQPETIHVPHITQASKNKNKHNR
jgi:hydrophobic/amphiphilic exporter-1 (mainly G- bacteria), HAE1 family